MSFSERPSFGYVAPTLFAMFLPGTLLSIFQGFQPILLPTAILDLIFPYTILPIEKDILVHACDLNTRTLVCLTPTSFAQLSYFEQQVFVLALICAVVVMASYAFQAKARAFYVKPIAALLWRPMLGVLIIGFYCRLGFAYIFIIGVQTTPHSLPTEIAVYTVMNVFAPEAVILMSCLIATMLAQGVFLIFKAVSNSNDY